MGKKVNWDIVRVVLFGIVFILFTASTFLYMGRFDWAGAGIHGAAAIMALIVAVGFFVRYRRQGK